MTPREYKEKYRAWLMDKEVVEAILTCVCGCCAICCIVRPFALQAEFKDVGEYEEDNYVDEE
jgi:hypothetical protein